MVSRPAISVLFREGSFFQENGRPARGLIGLRLVGFSFPEYLQGLSFRKFAQVKYIKRKTGRGYVHNPVSIYLQRLILKTIIPKFESGL
jgi:hypothetical protein